MNVHSTLYDLDIKKLFNSFNNFGQNQIIDEHLKGFISGNCSFSASFDSTFSIRNESILSENSIIIRDGELTNFSPLLALSRFVEVEELRNIQFETLENNILIKEEKVIIPSMDIRNNALNISASGIHEFNNHFDYRIRLKLSEILYNKSRGAKSSEFIIAEDESDTRVVFLRVFNEGNETKVEIDRGKTADKIRGDLNQEKVELKRLLKEELGLYKNDTTLIEKKGPQKIDNESFKFEFSEEDDSSIVDSTGRKALLRKKRVKKEPDQNKPAVEFVIDEQP